MNSGFKIASPISLRYDRIEIVTAERNSAINIYKDHELVAYKIMPDTFHVGDVINLVDLDGELKVSVKDC